MGLDAEKRGLVASDDAFDKWASEHTTGSIPAREEREGMRMTNDRRREVAAKVRETMGALGQVELDGIPLADLIEPEECDGCEPGAWEVVAMEAAERLGVAVGGCLPSDYADAIGEALDRRLMPEGYEWPRFEDGKQVRIGDEFAERIYGNPCKVGHFGINKYAFLIFDEEDVNDCESIDHGTHKRVKRPAPKVLGADGMEIRVGDEVWLSDKGRERDPGIHGEPMVVTGFSKVGNVNVIDQEDVKIDQDDPWIFSSDMLTHRAPVFAADGKPLREGETVWSTSGEFDGARTVERVISDDDEELPYEPPYAMFKDRLEPWSCLCCCLTHERPDSWERLEDDATKQPYAYCVEHGLDDDSLPTNEKFARDLVRRAKALTGVSE